MENEKKETIALKPIRYKPNEEKPFMAKPFMFEQSNQDKGYDIYKLGFLVSGKESFTAVKKYVPVLEVKVDYSESLRNLKAWRKFMDEMDKEAKTPWFQGRLGVIQAEASFGEIKEGSNAYHDMKDIQNMIGFVKNKAWGMDIDTKGKESVKKVSLRPPKGNQKDTENEL